MAEIIEQQGACSLSRGKIAELNRVWAKLSPTPQRVSLLSGLITGGLPLLKSQLIHYQNSKQFLAQKR